MAKISGPLLDRIDLHLEVSAVPYNELAHGSPGTTSVQMRQQVERARQTQSARFAGTKIRNNAQISSRQLRQWCVLDQAGRNLLENNVNDLGLSARAHDKVLRVARTIADLQGVDDIQCEHVAEAVNYRMLDRQFWT